MIACIVTFILIVITECICGCLAYSFKKMCGSDVKYSTVKIADSEYDSEEMMEMKELKE